MTIEHELSCTYCGPGTWAVWDVVTEEDLVFVCDRHHAEMKKARLIRLERRMGEKAWKQINEVQELDI
jgi:hypothetical protein